MYSPPSQVICWHFSEGLGASSEVNGQCVSQWACGTGTFNKWAIEVHVSSAPLPDAELLQDWGQAEGIRLQHGEKTW